MSEYFGIIKNVFIILFFITSVINIINFRNKKKGKAIINEVMVITLSSVSMIGWGIFYFADRIATGAELNVLNATISVLIVGLSAMTLVLTLKNRRLREEIK